MSEKIGVGIVCCAYSSPALITNFWESLKPSLDDPKFTYQLFLFRHGCWGDVDKACQKIADEGEYAVDYENYGQNRGLALSWNDGIEMAYNDFRLDACIVANDDLTWGEGNLHKLSDAAVNAEDDVYAVVCRGDHEVNGPQTPLGHSLFAYTRNAYNRLGFFDENFKKAYCEDQDISYRAWLAGMREIAVSLSVGHIGSAHMRGRLVPPQRIEQIRSQSRVTHALNREYIKKKWGEIADGRFQKSVPFGDNDGRLAADSEHSYHPYYIGAGNRHAPYPGHNRDDWGPEVGI